MLRALTDYTAEPAEVLAVLNRRLHGRLHGGFVTCMVMLLDAEGHCVLASAGHPPPFVNHQEVHLAGALPLGMVPEAVYEQETVVLKEGDHLVLYTDGLLEARAASGELYSFERLSTLMQQKPNAEQAAKAATDFGQEDDITVLTLTRLAAGETIVHTAENSGSYAGIIKETVVISIVLAVMAAAATNAEAATQAAIARVQAVDAKIHAVLALDPTALDQARAIDRRRKVRGVLYGYAILLKDNVEADGPLPTTAGSMALLDNVTHRDAPLVARLRGEDAVILGKTNLSEWANIRSDASISGWSGVGGQTRNPFALDRDPCGSSSGSGAAVAAGEVEAAIGTETDGSITCPAAINGVVGLKPTVGLVSRSRIVPISHSQDTAGPIAADVTTAAKVLTAIAGEDPDDPATKGAHVADYLAGLKPDALKGARIGVLRFATGWSAGTDKVFEQALAVLKAQGATLVDIKDMKDRDQIGKAETMVLHTELKADLNAYLATTPPP